MYKIEYYKAKKKPEIKRPVLNPNASDIELKKISYEIDKYLKLKKRIEKTWNIKSLTISRQGIFALLNAKNRSLLGLVMQYQRLSNNYDGIKILNNNPVNEELILKILDEEWLINEDDITNFTDEDIKRIEEKILEAKEKLRECENTNNHSISKVNLNHEINRCQYMLNVIENRHKIEDSKVIKKGTTYFN